MNIAFTAQTGPHEMLVEEVRDNWGQVVGIRFTCEPCKELQAFLPTKYEKYREALQAARDAGKTHTGVDSLTWRLVL